MEAMRQAISKAADASPRTGSFLMWRPEQILKVGAADQDLKPPSRLALYRLLDKLTTGIHTTSSAKTRRSQAHGANAPLSELPGFTQGSGDADPFHAAGRTGPLGRRSVWRRRADRHGRRRDQDGDGGGAEAHDEDGRCQRAAGPHGHPFRDPDTGARTTHPVLTPMATAADVPTLAQKPDARITDLYQQLADDGSFLAFRERVTSPPPSPTPTSTPHSDSPAPTRTAPCCTRS